MPFSPVRSAALLALFAAGVLAGSGCGKHEAEDSPSARAETVSRWLKEAPEKAHAVLEKDAASLRSHAAEWTPELVHQLESPDAGLRVKAADALGALAAGGGEAGAPLAAAAHDADARVRRAAVRALARLQPAPRDVVETIAASLADAEPDVRLEAVDALSDAANTDARARLLVVQALGDPDGEVVDHAMARLSRLGPECVPCLVEALGSSKATLVRCAAITLAALGERAGPAREALEGLLKNGSGPLRAAGAVALGRLGKHGLPSLPRLREALDDAEEDVADRASQAIQRLAHQGPDALHTILEGLADPRARVRTGTLKALVGLDADPEVLFPAVRPSFQDADRNVRYQAIQVVQGWRLGATRARAELEGLLNDPDVEVHREAVFTLGLLARGRPELGELIEVIGTQLDAPEDEVRATASRVLEALGTRAKPLFPRLVKALDDPQGEVRYFSLLTLKSLGADSLPAREKLVERLADAQMSVRREAATTLGLHGAAGVASVPALLLALKDDHPDVRLAAVAALGQLGPTARDAAGALDLLSDDEAQTRDVRLAARKAAAAVRKGS